MSYAYLAFFMGFFGSLHCLFMCGPLVFALPNKWVYHAGRLLTYSLLGAVLALIGNSFTIKSSQLWISLITGALLIVFALFHFIGIRNAKILALQNRIFSPVVRTMGKLLQNPKGSFLAGMFNGLLPCGMVYMALVSAMQADGIGNGMLFMLFFGLGTSPMMLGLTGFSGFLKRKLKFNFNQWLPIIWLIMGTWFVLRGANLDIPYLSPYLFPEGAVTCD